jgi:GDSL-like Lipase/Acylhydrolase family
MVRKIALNFCALIVGVIFSLVFLEVALRIYNPIIETIKGERVALHVNYDETRKNTRTPGVAPESHIHQNSLGFRGADPPADFADRLTIISVGGSTTRSVTQSDDRTWTALLGDAVAECFDRTWINNAGFEGHTSFAHIDLIRTYINKLHPKVVVLLIGANELFVDFVNASERASGHPAVVRWRWQQYEADLKTRFEDLNWRDSGGIKSFLVDLASRSEIVDLGLTLYRSLHAWKTGLNSADLADGDTMPDAEARLAVAREVQPEYAERLRLIIRLLRDAQTIPVLMTQPTFSGTGRDPVTAKGLSQFLFGQFFQQTFEIYNDTMRQVALSEGIFLIDLARSMPKDTKYYFDHMHYTDAGAMTVAKLVAMELLPYLARKFPSFHKDSCQIVPANPG